MIIVNSFQLLTIITKHSILDVAAALDPPLYMLLFMLLLSKDVSVSFVAGLEQLYSKYYNKNLILFYQQFPKKKESWKNI